MHSLTIDASGNMYIYDNDVLPLWSTYTGGLQVPVVQAQLLNSGLFVLVTNTGAIVWSSGGSPRSVEEQIIATGGKQMCVVCRCVAMQLVGLDVCGFQVCGCERHEPWGSIPPSSMLFSFVDSLAQPRPGRVLALPCLGEPSNQQSPRAMCSSKWHNRQGCLISQTHCSTPTCFGTYGVPTSRFY